MKGREAIEQLSDAVRADRNVARPETTFVGLAQIRQKQLILLGLLAIGRAIATRRDARGEFKRMPKYFRYPATSSTLPCWDGRSDASRMKAWSMPSGKHTEF